MTKPVPIRRRTPAEVLRHIADRLTTQRIQHPEWPDEAQQLLMAVTVNLSVVADDLADEQQG